jgi:hypothetical protein
MRRRWAIPLGLMENWWGTGALTNENFTARLSTPLEENALTKHFARRLLGKQNADPVLEVLFKTQNSTWKRFLGNDNTEWGLLKRNLAYMGMSSAFQWR